MYQQIHGTAMGTKMAPSYANLFMQDLEESFLRPRPDQPALWKRYIDDILILWPHSKETLYTLLQDLNQFHPTIKFTHELSDQSINFLDLTIYKGPRFQEKGLFDIKTYFKPTNSFQYLHYSTCHPKSTLKGIIKGETVRFLRSTSDQTTYQKTLTDLKHHLLLRGYPKQTITQTFTSTPFSSRENYLTLISTISNPDLETPHPQIFSTNFTPHTTGLKNTLTHPWCIITGDAELSTLYPDKPTICYRKNKTNAQHLVKAITPGDPPQKTSTLPPGITNFQPHPRIFKCGHGGCKVCPKILPLEKIKGHPLHQKLNCSTKNVIYTITCTHCPEKIYIGQTTTGIQIRFRHHRFRALQPSRHEPLYKHFRQKHHNFDTDHRITLLESCTRTKLSEREQHWIATLNTKYPHGLNSIFAKNYIQPY